jgi:NCS1 family nucleobase:cation symporter-1
VSLAMIAVALSTLATNIAANIVSPANDFANLAPSKINFRTGGFITGIVGILIFPWKLVADPGGYIFTWLVGYSSLLGPVGGILIADYYFIRRQRLVVPELYRQDGVYSYKNGFNGYAIGSLLMGIVPNIPGFLVTIGVLRPETIPAWLTGIYSYAWFVGFFVSGVSYCWLMRAAMVANNNKEEEVNYVIAD